MRILSTNSLIQPRSPSKIASHEVPFHLHKPPPLFVRPLLLPFIFDSFISCVLTCVCGQAARSTAHSPLAALVAKRPSARAGLQGHSLCCSLTFLLFGPPPTVPTPPFVPRIILGAHLAFEPHHHPLRCVSLSSALHGVHLLSPSARFGHRSSPHLASARLCSNCSTRVRRPLRSDNPFQAPGCHGSHFETIVVSFLPPPSPAVSLFRSD